MYLAHFGLDEAPFRITPHTEFFFAGANRGATLEGLLYAVMQDEGIVKVTGEVGSGKTMLCRVLIERMPESAVVIYLANPSVSRDELLHVLAADLQAASESDKTTIRLRALQDRLIELYAQGKRVVVLIDEAHAMPQATLEEIRLLSNLESNRHKLLQIALFGQPELDEVLLKPHMRQLRERITHSFRLEPLVRSDIEQYIDFRMRAAGYRGPDLFSAPALRAIARASQGLTRRINILADKALLAAYADNAHEVSAKHARAAIRDAEYRKAGAQLNPLLAAAALLVAGVGLGMALRWEGPSETTQPAQITAPAPPAQAATNENDTPAAQEPASPVQYTPIVAAGPVPPTKGELVRARYEATQRWLKKAPSNAFTIHLTTVAASQLPALEKFLKQAADVVSSEQLHVYGLKIEGRQHYAVAYGLYPDVSSTITAMGALPPLLKARGPYHRSIAMMRRQNEE